MKRIVIVILLEITLLTLCACQKCKHENIKLISDTTTCSSNGIKTYRCIDCGITFIEDSVTSCQYNK